MQKNEKMILVSDILSQWVNAEFKRLFNDANVEIPSTGVVTTSNPEFGDYQCNDAMALAKILKKPPRAIAESFSKGAVLHPALDRVEIAGPGFINIFLKTDWLANYLCIMAEDTHLGVPQVGNGHTVVIDYSSPNVAKPMHIGHIRSTIIGSAIDRMHRFLGYRVISDNHIGDWGTQFGILIMGYRHFADKKALEESPVEELERLYVKSYGKTKEDESWLAQCRQELVKLQSGDPENRKLWKEFVDLSLEEFQRIYKRLGVSFDLIRGESYYNDKLKAMVELLEGRGLARESEGATVVFLDDEKLPVCIVRKSDGAFNYATSDLATIASRVNEFEPDKIVYVTDERQQLHFRQFFAIARKLGYRTRFDHVWFGLMRLPEGTFSTREGNVIKLERLLDEAEQRALSIVQKTSPEMKPEQQKEVARAVGIGAVKYADLSQNPQTTVTFTWEKALALDGNSGPYLQYAYARIASVLDKYIEKYPSTNPDNFPLKLAEPIERTLALILVRLPDIVLRAAETYKPSTLADYLYDLAQIYSTFYQNVPFLKAEEGIRESRVRLCSIVAKVLRTGLNLLSIDTPERI
ncbi:MAG: arginine--tRNA ligase [Kiritimatiellae bacterium]|nr:arginine--tRNA ligase [Kiritimatiellia bacterium]MDD5523189.1 arginine--tRNA ligase [Kiritimatiellia bacterium]